MIKVLSCCGIDCSVCKNYKKNLNCQGCQEEKEMINDGPTRSCTAKKKIANCGECATFPCKGISDFYNSGEFRIQGYLNLISLKNQEKK